MQREPYLWLSLQLEKRESLLAIVIQATYELLLVKTCEFELLGSQNSSIIVTSGEAHRAGKDPLDSLNLVLVLSGTSS